MRADEEYQARLAEREKALGELRRRFNQIGNVRLLTGLILAAVAIVVFGPGLIPAMFLSIPIGAMVVLKVWQGRVGEARERRQRAVRFYQAGLARLDDRWMGAGSRGEELRPPEHVFADDLDVFGKGSLFELISQARTREGERTLAGWFLRGAAPEEARARQAAVRELSARIDLREDVFVLGSVARCEMDSERLRAWAAGNPSRFAWWWRPFAFLLAGLGMAAIVLLFAGKLPLSGVVAILACDAAVIYGLREPVDGAFEGLLRASRDLDVLGTLVGRLERESFASPRGQRINEALKVEGVAASGRIRRLARIIAWVDSSEHVIVRIFRGILLWKQQCAFAVERWRLENGALVAGWLTAVADFEALSSLASIAYERPAWTFPELVPDEGGLFKAEALRHPLIAPGRAIGNNVAIGGGTRLLIISGSNMSGKSTLLRAIGLNTILAWAGGPVAAAALRVSPLQPGASIRIADSVQDQRSRFFAEITRLRQIVELPGVRVLFLLDELLSGTNSHDRRLGAEAVVKALVDGGSIGCLTTHDLALAEMERDLGGRAMNVHFDDQFENGRMTFDYTLRPGVVARSNALELMRAIGLIEPLESGQ